MQVGPSAIWRETPPHVALSRHFHQCLQFEGRKLGHSPAHFPYRPNWRERARESESALNAGEQDGQLWRLLHRREGSHCGEHLSRVPQKVSQSQSHSSSSNFAFKSAHLANCPFNLTHTASDWTLILGIPTMSRRLRLWRPMNPPPCSSISLMLCDSTTSFKEPFRRSI